MPSTNTNYYLLYLKCHQVYVSDPKAMYHMLVKDAAIYEETTWYIECVFQVLAYPEELLTFSLEETC